MSRIDEIKKRRTFAIISHPDAGMTGWILRKKEVFP